MNNILRKVDGSAWTRSNEAYVLSYNSRYQEQQSTKDQVHFNPKSNNLCSAACKTKSL